MDRIYRLLKDRKEEELKRMVEEGEHFADFVRIFRLLEDQSLEELIEAHEKKAAGAGKAGAAGNAVAEATDAETVGAGVTITVSDLNYRIRKAIKEPKRIFEPHQPYKKPGKWKRG
jgi:hypothetical protein